MSIKDYLDLGYAGLVVVAIVAYVGVKVYGEHHTIKNKWIAQIPDLAAAFVHEAETTGGDGTKKMDIVITSVVNILTSHGVQIDPTIEAAIKAYAEKEVAKMNANKPTTKPADKAESVDNFDETKVKDEVGTDSNA
ncbi:phage holin, LLH family [Lactobacillus sp. ESL0680]|uniref:phage holin, LLH family n=1 Tax=Lactobacillus sp. ESL0680 TaxID=2983210 RepID=UPI0023F87567|nr:phage holin, LLH family [Lactobacillus sp. ESL0680]WEV39295.1 phage holin, LLH family [Lactobacillus sp. ESL0680]